MPERKRRWGRVLLVLLLVLVVLLVVADRVGVLIAERTVANQAAGQLAAEQISTSAAPSVKIAGFPFLTQVAAGTYQEIDIDLPDPKTRGVQLDDLRVVATDVTAPTSELISGNATITAARVSGAAHLGWNAFAQMIDLTGLGHYGVDTDTLKIDGTNGGKIRITVPMTVLGQSFTALATGAITVSKNVLHVRIDSIQASGADVPIAAQDVLGRLKQRLSFDITVPPLPYHLSVDSVTADSSGVSINVSARHVTLAS